MWPLVGLAAFSTMGAAPCELQIDGNRASFRTPSMEVEIENGAIVRLFNALTRTEFFLPAKASPEIPDDLSSGLVYVVEGKTEREESVGVVGETPLLEGQTLLKPELLRKEKLTKTTCKKAGNCAVEYAFAADDNTSTLTIRYEIDPQSGDLLVTQRASGKREALSGVRFGMGPVTCRGSLILPVFNGMRAMRKESLGDYDKTRWEWPTGWSLPWAIFSDPVGGFWIHSEDEKQQFKAVDYRYLDKGQWLIAFDSINHAPFAPHTGIDGVTWRINTFEGDWTVPAERYKKWSHTFYQMADKAKYRPDWVRDLKLQIKKADTVQTEDFEAYLDELAKHIDPKTVLLYLHSGKNDRAFRFNDEARKRGFRTMYYELYFALFDSEPDFETFKPYIIRNPYTNEMMGWNLQNEWRMGVKLYYASPAHKPFRDHKIAQYKETFAKSPADGIFLDQSFLVFNDNQGLRDGQSIVDGNIAYHREVAEAFPGIAIGGEGINEISFQYESVCEIHPLGVYVDWEDPESTWDINPAAFERMVPALAHYLEPYTRILGYLAWPDAKHKYYPAWRDSLAVCAGIPTLRAPSLEDLQNPDSEVRHALRKIAGSK